MKDLRKTNLKWLKYQSYALIVLMVLLTIGMSLVVIDRTQTGISNGFTAIGLILSVIAVAFTAFIYTKQSSYSFELSILESKIQHCERSLDTFYLPLLTLLLSQKDGIIDLSKLEEIKGCNYLAGKEVSIQFDIFYKEYSKSVS
jgi:prepilin signal peptidase PulO-like enzyme (type II secretory pathway)